MTELDLDAITARAEAALPGPWTVSTDEPSDVVIWGPAEDGMVMQLGERIRLIGDVDPNEKSTADFIAAARIDVPALIERVRELEAENARLRGTSSMQEALQEGIAALGKAEADRSKLLEALKPFALLNLSAELSHDDYVELISIGRPVLVRVRVGDLRRAAAVVEEIERKP